MSMSMRLPKRESTRSGVAEGEVACGIYERDATVTGTFGGKAVAPQFLQPSDSRCSKFGPITPLLVLFVLV